MKDFLYEKINIIKEAEPFEEISEIIEIGLSKKINLREYQKEAFQNFIYYYENDNLKKNKQIHTLFHMATGSGKTVIMAGLILYLYTKGYRKFLFFVNQTNVLEKTIDNFTNTLSSKYLFADNINYLGNNIKISKVDNFSGTLNDDIEIVFTTTQSLHQDLFYSKENSLTYDDFENNKVVFISDESHHINSSTKKKNKLQEEVVKTWEDSVMRAFYSNKDSIMLEFTATCDLKDKNVVEKYLDKIIFNYPLKYFRESGYTKDFQNFATDTDFWKRTLIALVMSEYRRFLFSDLKLNIKPVVMLKSKKIKESEDFYGEFYEKINKITSEELENLKNIGIDLLKEAIDYFKEKDGTLETLIYSIKNSFLKNNSIIMNGSTDNSKENQMLVNSLEDLDNPIRLIFAVDMLNEGWDVLNLFDIVRLYDTRQGGETKVADYTIKEAQLIGRGARYCPFLIDGMELETKFKRKYDFDLTNKNRILETMFFHSKNDSKYISELKKALIETGLQSGEEMIELEYKIKEEFKNTEFYNKTYVFSNKRVEKSRIDVDGIEERIINKIYTYKVQSNKGQILSFYDENKIQESENENRKNFKFKDIEMNILLGASECFDELKFNVLKNKYPRLKSIKEFLISDKYLGNINLEIIYYGDKLISKDIYLGVKKVLNSISDYIISLKPSYEGTREFYPKLLKQVLRNKKINISKPTDNYGKGHSQNSCISEEYKLNLEKEHWYVFNDNYGTTEEKYFIKYFKNNIESKLKEKNLEYYVVRNERIPELAIYSFEKGERFEPDFLLFVKKKNYNENIIYQSYIEPKGTQLLMEDIWKNNFLMEIGNNSKVEELIIDEYKVLGLPFFNKEMKIKEFEKSVNDWINNI